MNFFHQRLGLRMLQLRKRRQPWRRMHQFKKHQPRSKLPLKRTQPWRRMHQLTKHWLRNKMPLKRRKYLRLWRRNLLRPGLRLRRLLQLRKLSFHPWRRMYQLKKHRLMSKLPLKRRKYLRLWRRNLLRPRLRLRRLLQLRKLSFHPWRRMYQLKKHRSKSKLPLKRRKYQRLWRKNLLRPRLRLRRMPLPQSRTPSRTWNCRVWRPRNSPRPLRSHLKKLPSRERVRLRRKRLWRLHMNWRKIKPLFHPWRRMLLLKMHRSRKLPLKKRRHLRVQ